MSLHFVCGWALTFGVSAIRSSPAQIVECLQSVGLSAQDNLVCIDVSDALQISKDQLREIRTALAADRDSDEIGRLRVPAFSMNTRIVSGVVACMCDVARSQTLVMFHGPMLLLSVLVAGTLLFHEPEERSEAAAPSGVSRFTREAADPAPNGRP